MHQTLFLNNVTSGKTLQTFISEMTNVENTSKRSESVTVLFLYGTELNPISFIDSTVNKGTIAHIR